MSNHGSKLPLNWKTQEMSEPVKKSTSYDEKVDIYHRNGTPPTRRGAYNGAPSNLRPNRDIPEMNPELYLGKGFGGMQQNQQPQPPQPQQPHPPGAGSASGGGQPPQMTQQQGGGQSPMQPKAPGFDQTGMNQMMAPEQSPVAMTSSGQPIYADPFHPAHQGFSANDHMEAAQMHHGAAAHDPQAPQNASIHQQMASESAPPAQRVMQQGQPGMLQPQPGGMPGTHTQPGGTPGMPPQQPQMGQDPMGAFMQQYVSPGQMNPDQNKPVGPPMGGDRNVPKPNMTEVAPTQASHTAQSQAGNPYPRDAGATSPNTHAGYQATPVLQNPGKDHGQTAPQSGGQQHGGGSPFGGGSDKQESSGGNDKSDSSKDDSDSKDDDKSGSSKVMSWMNKHLK